MPESFESIEHQYRDAFSKYTVPSSFKSAQGNFDQLLLSYLYQSPYQYDNRIPIDQSTTDSINGILWFKLCGGSKHLYTKLTHASNVDMQATGKACGHMFRKGDGIFRCRTCGLDDTCVLCASCFKATGHDGHDTNFSYSAGSGGFCDCGDAEAWKVPLNCKYHSPTAIVDTSGSSNLSHVSLN
jgi:Putative zinc finger in N-recognin (UBR box)